MSKELKISRELSLPLEAVTEKFAFLGKSGSGKTYASMKLCELMLEVGMQVIVLDLVGPWYGLRISADGKGKGFEIPIFGGLHGDFELHPELGEHVAEIIVERGISAVIDISQMIDSEQTKFATAFGRRFYDLKKRRPSAVHLFMEECELLVPQNPEKDETKKLNIYKRIVKIGRNFGIGCSQISQRPQDINKKALNQTEVLFVFQTTGPHERKAVMEWMRDKEITDVGYSDLAKLEKGVARVWSPSWLKVSKTLKVDKKITFDSSATPKYGETRTEEPKKLTDDDIIKIREMIDSARRKMLEPEKTEKRKPGKSLKSEDQLNSAEIDSLRGENETLRQNIQQETEARRLAEEKLKKLRDYLKPQFESLKFVFDELNGYAAQVPAGRKMEIYEAWFPKLGAASSLLKALLDPNVAPNGRLSKSKAMVATKLGRDSIRIYANKLKRSELIRIEGDELILNEI